MLNRRQFLLGLGRSASLLGLHPLLSCRFGAREAPLLVTPQEEWANGICQLCPSACGLRLRLVNGHPVTVAGNPFHPVNRGGLCARGAATLQLYYDPDRIPGPLRRDAGVIGGWAPTGWGDALGEVTDQFREAVEAGPGRVAVIRGGRADVTSELLGRLVQSADSKWIVDVTTPAERATEDMLAQMHGLRGALVYDVAGADFVLSLDSGLLEASARAMGLHRAFAEMRGAGGQFVHAGPCLGVTGTKADEWLPIRPHTGGILALGVAHMLIKEGYARTEFLADHVSGFEDVIDDGGRRREGVRSWILHEFSPERVAQLTGVGSSDVIRVARRLGAAQRPCAIGPVNGIGAQPGNLIAVHTLNAVLGAIDAPGGVLLARRAPLEALEEPAEDGGRTVEELAEWVLGSKTPRIDVCIVHEADPVFSTPAGAAVARALHRIPLVVSTSPVMTDTTAVATLVLPDRLWLERRSDATVTDQRAQPVVSISAAAVAPRADSRSVADVVLTLAHAVGGRVAARFPWKSYDQVLDWRTEQLFGSGVGDAFSSVHRSVWAQLLERSGWRAASYQTVAELRRDIEARGGWWDPAYYHGEWRRVVATPDRRIDLMPVRRAIPASTAAEGQELGGDALILYVHPELTLDTRIGGSLPYLQDLGSPLFEAAWVTGAGLNPQTAARRQLAPGDRVRIRRGDTSIEARLYVSPGIRPDVVVVHTGEGREHGGRYAGGVGSNPLRLLATPGREPEADRSWATAVHVEAMT